MLTQSCRFKTEVQKPWKSHTCLTPKPRLKEPLPPWSPGDLPGPSDLRTAFFGSSLTTEDGSEIVFICITQVICDCRLIIKDWNDHMCARKPQTASESSSTPSFLTRTQQFCSCILLISNMDLYINQFCLFYDHTTFYKMLLYLKHALEIIS